MIAFTIFSRSKTAGTVSSRLDALFLVLLQIATNEIRRRQVNQQSLLWLGLIAAPGFREYFFFRILHLTRSGANLALGDNLKLSSLATFT